MLSMNRGAWWVAVHGVAQSRTRLKWLSICMHALEKETAAHSGVLAGRIPGTKEPGGLPSMGSHRVRDDWSDLAAATIIYKISSNIVLWSFCLLFLLNLCVHVLGTASLYKMYFSLLVTMKKVWHVVRVTTINRVRHLQSPYNTGVSRLQAE